MPEPEHLEAIGNGTVQAKKRQATEGREKTYHQQDDQRHKQEKGPFRQASVRRQDTHN
jgi:hypothetical protein